jgi:hypothetical protein
MASESKGNDNDHLLPFDTVCANCEFPMYKGTPAFVRMITNAGDTVYECERCGNMSSEDRIELARLGKNSVKNFEAGQMAYDSTRGQLISEADMEESVGGTVDYAHWAAAAPVTAASVEPAISTPAAMAAEIERMRAASAFAAASAAAEWAEKAAVFTAPCDVENWSPDDSLASFMDWKSSAIRNVHNAEAERRWLGRHIAGAAATPDVPPMSEQQARLFNKED